MSMYNWIGLKNNYMSLNVTVYCLQPKRVKNQNSMLVNIPVFIPHFDYSHDTCQSADTFEMRYYQSFDISHFGGSLPAST